MLSILLRCVLIINLMVLASVRVVIAAECYEDSNPSCVDVPITIQARYTFNTDNWYPLPEEAMKSATVDTALANLSNSGYFAFKDGTVATGFMDFDISLIGPAETIKLTIQLFLPDHPTFVATASMSVKQLDHQGIYQAFEELGRASALRMLDKFNAYVMNEPEYQVVEVIRQKDNKALEALYDLAQQYKGRSYMLTYAAKKLNRPYRP